MGVEDIRVPSISRRDTLRSQKCSLFLWPACLPSLRCVPSVPLVGTKGSAVGLGLSVPELFLRGLMVVGDSWPASVLSASVLPVGPAFLSVFGDDGPAVAVVQILRL